MTRSFLSLIYVTLRFLHFKSTITSYHSSFNTGRAKSEQLCRKMAAYLSYTIAKERKKYFSPMEKPVLSRFLSHDINKSYRYLTVDGKSFNDECFECSIRGERWREIYQLCSVRYRTNRIKGIVADSTYRSRRLLR